MRLILMIRAVCLLRLARHDVARSDMLSRWSKDALDRAEARVRASHAIADLLMVPR
ncbi:hypothetical protein MTDSW087_05371 [Methylobacterium dankookense]|uniref:Uncharacterized protein n=1 Tax=Methylobacterium dankookense TaxID=560405 RepID=A0A564G5N3_9HYPH|nr:hypothetical protein IFDJLNFL_4287 [Methylobacterium dankookense]VUF15627.1 hypothetical protein MTDSW087_05371 [Methylobacterium dankookense]